MRDPFDDGVDLETPTYSVIGVAVMLILVGAFFRADPVLIVLAWSAFVVFAYAVSVGFWAWSRFVGLLAASRVSDNTVALGCLFAAAFIVLGMVLLLG